MIFFCEIVTRFPTHFQSAFYANPFQAMLTDFRDWGSFSDVAYPNSSFKILLNPIRTKNLRQISSLTINRKKHLNLSYFKDLE
jgi:hypothetical protein